MHYAQLNMSHISLVAVDHAVKLSLNVVSVDMRCISIILTIYVLHGEIVEESAYLRAGQTTTKLPTNYKFAAQAGHPCTVALPSWTLGY